MPPAPDVAPRERMVLAAVGLLAERGLGGASFSEVIERSGAARGSIYHHFPEGKDALTSAAIALAGERVLTMLRRRDLTTPAEVVARFVAGWRALLVKSSFRAGCAIAAVANERLDHPELGEQAGKVFAACEGELAEALVAVGMARPRAGVAASLVLAACEGAVILCRARRDIAPLDAVGTALASFVAE